MSRRSSLPGRPPQERTATRLRALGLPLLECDTSGRLRSDPETDQDWLGGLLRRSSRFTTALRQAAERWLSEEDPVPLEVLPGCWLAPVPRMARRRRLGYVVAVIATGDLLRGDLLAAMCREAGADAAQVAARLAALPPVPSAEVTRTSVLVRQVIDDEAQHVTDTEALESVGQQLAESYEEMNLLYSTIQSMSEVDRPGRFVRGLCRELLATLPYAWIGALFAAPQDRMRQGLQLLLRRLAGELICEGEPNQTPAALRKLCARLLTRVQPESPLVIDPLGQRGEAAFLPLGRSVLVQPIGREGTVIGILVAGGRRGPDPAVSNVDIKLLGATATSMGIFLENAALYEDLNSMFLGTLEALTAAIDAKDPYTRGHSQRVAHLTQQLARALELDEEQVRQMRIAGLVHDVGKIGVPEAVLTKPGRLTEQEFVWIRRHPEIGYRILKDIPQLREILPGVLYHHERFDGAGYPEGLAGEAIPSVARLIALADAFDAMSSTRTYRPAMSRVAVLREIRDCAGTQFDPKFVPTFLGLDFGVYDRMFALHQASGREPSRETDRAA